MTTEEEAFIKLRSDLGFPARQDCQSKDCRDCKGSGVYRGAELYPPETCRRCLGKKVEPDQFLNGQNSGGQATTTDEALFGPMTESRALSIMCARIYLRAYFKTLTCAELEERAARCYVAATVPGVKCTGKTEWALAAYVALAKNERMLETCDKLLFKSLDAIQLAGNEVLRQLVPGQHIPEVVTP